MRSRNKYTLLFYDPYDRGFQHNFNGSMLLESLLDLGRTRRERLRRRRVSVLQLRPSQPCILLLFHNGLFHLIGIHPQG